MKSPCEVSRVVCLRPGAKNKGGIDEGSELSRWTINLQYSVAADTQRIFNALTVPEYIEAWICVPGCNPECRNVTCWVSRGFEIAHHCNPGAKGKISGTYISFLKRKLSFSWRPAWAPNAHASLVDIRLYGDFEKSTLRLRHFGLESEEEFNWHLSLWSVSVARLCRLFGNPALHTDRRRQQISRKPSGLLCSVDRR